MSQLTKNSSKIKQIESARDYAEAIVETVREPLVILDSKLRVISANKAFYKEFHVGKRETIKQLIYDIGNGQWNNPKLKHLLKNVLTKRTSITDFEVEQDFPVIGKRTVLLNASRIIQKHNQKPLILLAIEDITAKKIIERQKDDFISIASHELKTPITSMKVYGQILKRHPLITKDKKAFYLLTKMDSQLGRLNELVASFVNVYKLQTGKLKLNKTQFLMEELVAEVITNFQYTIDSHVVGRIGESKLSVFADRDKINQVLINLISNAIKYSPKANKVVVILSSDGENIKVGVQDFGIGIPKENQHRIFERFFRVQTKKENTVPGLGLGLYISNEIIKQHHGNLWVESQKDKGSTFYFDLPSKRNQSE